MLRALETTSRLTYRKLNDIIAAKEEILKVISEKTDIRRPQQLSDAIFTQPYTRVMMSASIMSCMVGDRFL